MWDAAVLLVDPIQSLAHPPLVLDSIPELSHSAVTGLLGLFTMPYNFTGQPALSLPLYWTRKNVPIGVQFVAAYGREDLLIQLASQLETAHPWAGHYSI